MKKEYNDDRQLDLRERPLMARIFDYFEEKLDKTNSLTPFNAEITILKDVVYKTTEDGEELVMDIYLPSREIQGKRPVIYDIPGGGWMIHNRKRRSGYARLYATMGAVVCVIDHRLCPSILFPNNLQDCIDGLNFLTTIADKYNLDLDDITLTGDSSGGHLGACVACCSSNDEYVKRVGVTPLKVKIKRNIFISGAFSFDAIYRIPMTHTLIVRYVSGRKSRSEFKKWKYYREINPYNYLTTNYPATYNSGGAYDLFCLFEARHMSKRLDKLGVDNVYYISKYLGADHCYIFRFPDWYARGEMKKLITWYYNKEQQAGKDLSEGYELIMDFLDTKNYKKFRQRLRETIKKFQKQKQE